MHNKRLPHTHTHKNTQAKDQPNANKNSTKIGRISLAKCISYLIRKSIAVLRTECIFYHIFRSDRLFILCIVCQLNGTILVHNKKQQTNKFVVARGYSIGVSLFYFSVLVIAIDRILKWPSFRSYLLVNMRAQTDLAMHNFP